MNQSEKPIYRILYVEQEEVKEVYAQYISEETLVGFIEADTLLNHNARKSAIPTNQVRRCYIPLHNILRIDEIIAEKAVKEDNISHLHAFKKPPKKAHD